MSLFPTLFAELLLDNMNAKTSITAVACLFHIRLALDRLAAFTSTPVSWYTAISTLAATTTHRASGASFVTFAYLFHLNRQVLAALPASVTTNAAFT